MKSVKFGERVIKANGIRKGAGLALRGVLTLLACGAIGTAFQAFEANATTSFSQLPDMSQLTPFATFGNSYAYSSVTVNGDAGISSGGNINVAGPSTVNGNLYLGSGATRTGPGTVTGTTFSGSDILNGRNLTAAQQQVFTASSTFAGLTPDFSSAGNVSGS